MMVMLSLLGLHTVWVVLPLLPAILIYRLFPNTGVAVSGPLANLTVRASGAFAGYLVVFVATYPFVDSTRDTIGGFEHPFWTVNGSVRLIGANGREIQSDELLNKLQVHSNPDPYTVVSYMVKLKIVEGSEGDFPLVRVEVPGWGESIIDLRSNSNKITIDRYRKTIEIAEPIEVREAARVPLDGGAELQANGRTQVNGVRTRATQ